ncbi:ABC transporter permease [Actinobacteria bacterium YIM 96077]|uniref:ABC transporter permease n=1 Tax=Phytoactinopolyspora halophila TaxID=1981511 RepID=A0A329QYQ5_9ACTN|nr:ABC transporter permease [Phytoactinopolyspora halophila]AYY13397.1 ABC transporter permease [Actinobacteria bacterium YIM 96077]RAW17367.1 ABC transporter permease [Phytoactinopolyspora halophila]
MTETREDTPPEEKGPSAGQRFWQELTTGNIMVTLLSVVLALVIGAVLVAISDPRVQDAAGYFFARPGDLFSATWSSVGDAYAALFTGSLIDVSEYTVGRALRPFGETLTNATPLIAAGLAVAIAFRAGLFNIGAEGQIILGAIFAGYAGFAFDLPIIVHVTAAVVAGIVGGAIWAGIVGVLKAKTGAHEVIVTIMLNNIAAFLLAYLLGTVAFQRPGRQDPISPFVDESAQLPRLVESTRVHAGFLLAILAAAIIWWLLSRSTLGFRLRAVGNNPNAAHTAGMSVAGTYVVVFVLAGMLAGLAGASLALGTERHLNTGISGGLGFDAITVALLGRANPWGTVAAGILFGALRAGGVTMQARTGTPIDLVLVVQALIVLFIAAPPLIRAIFRIRVRAKEPVATASKGWES